jgi:TonB family protein
MLGTLDLDRDQSKIWWIAALLALAAHLLFFALPKTWFFPTDSRSRPAMPVAPISPQALEQLRKKIQQQSEPKSILLSPDSDKPKTEQPPPPKASAISDRNRTVVREQLARVTDVMPKPGAVAQAPQRPVQPKDPVRDQARKNESPSPLAKFGAPISLKPNRPSPESPSERSEARFQNQSPGAQQSFRDRRLPLGGENLLNTQESVYYSFYSRLYQSVAPNWQSMIREVPNSVSRPQMISQGEYTSVVEVILSPDGSLEQVVVQRSSGIPEFDRAAQTVWSRLKKFPNPPQGLREPDGRVRTQWSFTVTIGDGARWQFEDPARAE